MNSIRINCVWLNYTYFTVLFRFYFRLNNGNMGKNHKSATQYVSNETEIEQPPNSEKRTNVYPVGYWFFF